MNKPEPKVPFVISVFNPNEGSNGFMLNTSTDLIDYIIEARLYDMVEINIISPSRVLMVVNPCYDATEVRAYLEALLTEAHETWLETGGVDTEDDTDVTNETALKPRATAAAPETSDGDADAGSAASGESGSGNG